MTDSSQPPSSQPSSPDSSLQSEETLRYWLANEDWYPSRFTRAWLDRTPPEQAAETLARIAEDAQPQKHSLWTLIVEGFATSGFATSSAIAGGGPLARRAGTRAALLLADLEDPRALPPLVRVFEVESVWQSKFHELIEAALLRLLREAADSPEQAALLTPYRDSLRSLAERLWNSHRGQGDLAPDRVELLLASLRCLRAAHPEADEPLLQQIAAYSGRAPGRVRVRQAAAFAPDSNP